MQASSLTVLLLLSATSCLSSPLSHQKRYDLDGNGVPDWCYVDEACMAFCLGDNGHWSAVPATSCTVTTSSSSTAASTVAVTTTPATSLNATTTRWSTTTSTKTSSATTEWGITSSSTTTSSTSSTTSSGETTTASGSTNVAAALPSPSQFHLDKGSKWTVSYKGELQFTGALQTKKLDGDKCRTGQIGDSIIWNCGDMECAGNWEICGFSGGAAFYGTDSVMVVNTSDVVSVQDNNFLVPWSGDGSPTVPQSTWGMDTSNVAPINDTHGVAFAWEIWRGASDGSIVNKGNAVAWITLGDTKPIATRDGPLLTGPNTIQLGLLAILRDGDYIYSYSMGGLSKIIVGRVLADHVFEAAQYEFLSLDSDSDWVSGIPEASTTSIGATTSKSDGQFGCAGYGSVFFSDYFQQYVIVCSIDLMYVSMYLSRTPYGPWSDEYQLLSATTDAHVLGSYGSMVHPEFPVDNGFYMSMGPNSVFNMFEFNFDY